MALLASDFAFVVKLMRDVTGITFEADKQYYVEAKLGEVANQHTGGNLDTLLLQLKAMPRGALLAPVVEALVISETLFFRDRHPFRALETDVIPTLVERNKGKRRLRIWSAAASSGQEIYSVAMVLREHFPELAAWDVLMLASDVCDALVARARAGLFQQLEVSRGVPTALLLKYFALTNGRWEVQPMLRDSITFQRINLLEAWPPAEWDLVLLRYVLVYFDDATKARIVERMAHVLAPGGYLLLGGTERLPDPKGLFRRTEVDRTFFYVRTEAPAL